jgi:hypothetical protein
VVLLLLWDVCVGMGEVAAAAVREVRVREGGGFRCIRVVRLLVL